MILPIAWSLEEIKCSFGLQWIIFYSYFLALLNMIFQGAFIYHIYLMIQEEQGHCGTADPF
eukprot:UN34660